MILIDLSQICLSGSFAFSDSLRNGVEDTTAAKNILRHIILSQIKHYKKNYSEEYGEIVISCDSRNYWRKQIFAQYKAMRKKAREESDLNWQLIFETINEIVEDLRKYFPYKIIRVDSAESDDIIATITKKFVEEHPDKKVLIISSDQDFLQLHKFKNVYQLSPRTKKFLTVEDPIAYLKEKVIRGDRSDYIPNIFSEDDVFVTKGKQLPVTKTKLEEYMKVESANDIKDPIVQKHYIRNRNLIDFEFIPENISKLIVSEYESPIEGDKVKVFNYLIEHRCAALIKDIDNF